MSVVIQKYCASIRNYYANSDTGTHRVTSTNSDLFACVFAKEVSKRATAASTFRSTVTEPLTWFIEVLLSDLTLHRNNVTAADVVGTGVTNLQGTEVIPILSTSG